MDKFVIRKSSTIAQKEPSVSAASKELKKHSTTSDVNSASDISVKGGNIVQHHLPTYPKNKENRSFHANWFQKYEWLEYSKIRDAAFCYPCRQFLPFGTKENVFTSTGFRNWKMAMSKEKGFYKHASSEVHLSAMMMWREKLCREEKGLAVSTLINNDVLERHRYYVKSIIEVVQFLVLNELAFRGTYNIEEHQESSLFRNLFEFTLKKDEKLAECAKHIPRNCTYLSPEIQNIIIRIMAELVTESVANDVRNADVPWFSILEDGTKDKNNKENVAIGVRYVKDGQVEESILTIKTCTDCDAKSFVDLTLKTFTDYGLDTSHILSQCYDGAAVMSGDKNGVQKLIQKELNRTIPYVHCSNHRLHLVLMKAVKDISEITYYFDTCSMLYNFLKRGSISKFYQGQSLCRLLEQRWSGHLDTTRLVVSNYKLIIQALEEVSRSKDIDCNYVVEALGLITMIRSEEFIFCMIIMKKILETIQPADKIFQSHEASLKDSYTVTKSLMDTLESYRNDETYIEIRSKIEEEFSPVSSENANKRRRKKNPTLHDYVVYEKIGEPSTDDATENKFKILFFEVLDLILNEMKRRFLNNNDLLLALNSIDDKDIISLKDIKPLSVLGIEVPSEEEISVVNNFLQKQKATKKDVNIFNEIFQQRIAFEDTYSLLATVKTFGCSTATCESSFSTLTRINRPQRLSMCHQRMSDLTLLAFEKSRTKNLNIDLVLKKFNDCSARRLQLF